MASSVTVHIVNIRVNTVILGFASGNSIFLMLTVCTITLEAMHYLYNHKQRYVFDIKHNQLNPFKRLILYIIHQ